MNINTARQAISLCNEARIRIKGNICIHYSKNKENIDVFMSWFVFKDGKRCIRFDYKNILLIEVIE